MFAVDSEPANYDCHANVSFAFLHPVAPHYSTLLKFDTANYPQVMGDLADSWAVSSDKLTYSFKLRPGVLFHDGTPLTSTDVKASYLRIAHPPAGVVSARQVDYASISAIDTPDPLSIVFHLQWPDAAMTANFASPWNCIYRRRSSPPTRNSREPMCWGPARSCSSNTPRASIGKAPAGIAISSMASHTSTATRPISWLALPSYRAWRPGASWAASAASRRRSATP